MSWFKEAQKSKQVIDEMVMSVHDTDRYRTDKYECYVSLVKSATSYDVGFQINNSQLGVASNVEYWHYKLNEGSHSKKTYGAIVERTKNIIEEFELEKTPFALFGPMFRQALRDIDPDHKDTSGVYHTNKNIKNPVEGDWRKTIYGPRYPNTPVIGNSVDGVFAEQPRYQVQQSDKKNVETKGTGRKKQWSLNDVDN